MNSLGRLSNCGILNQYLNYILLWIFWGDVILNDTQSIILNELIVRVVENISV